MANYSQDAKYTAAYNKGLEASNKAKSYLADLNKQKPGTAKYNELKSKYDNAKSSADTYEAQRVARKQELDSAKANESKTKSAQKDKQSAKTDIPQLQYQLQVAVNKGDAAAVKSAQDALAAAQNKAAGIKPAVAGDTTGNTGNDKLTEADRYGTYTVDPSRNTVFGPGGNAVYLVTLPDGSQQEYGTMNQAREAFLSQYAVGNGVAGLQNQLLSKNIIKKSQVADGTWVKGVDYLINSYTFKTVSDFKYSGKTDTPSIVSFTKSMANVGGTGTGGVSKNQFITTRPDADRDLDSYMRDLVGRPATIEEKDSYYNNLNKLEKSQVSVTKDGVTTGQVIQETDRLFIAAKVARVSLRGLNVDDLLKSTTGSQVANDIADLQTTAASYGIEMSSADALKYVSSGVGTKDYLNKEKERIRQLGITMHPYLKDHIMAGGTVADVADQYASAKRSKLGVTIKTSTQDKDVMDAVAKGMTISDFNRNLQSKPEWMNTPEAHDAATTFTNTFLKSFGLVG